jgi:glycosyltransferase involved in cell wall biosynthesis
MKLTVYIPSYNVENYIEQAIRSLLDQTHPPDEILIVDDGSTDKTAEIASKFPVRLVRHDRNRGLAAARNTAFRNASHELVGAIDADVYAVRDWLERLLVHFSDPRVVGTGGRLIEAFRETPADAWRTLHMSQDLGDERIDIEGSSHRCLGGFGTIVKKSVAQGIGGYNEGYRTNYEDVDLFRRLVRVGHKLVFEPRAVAYHQRRDSVRSVVRNSWNWEFYIHYFSGGYNNIWLKILYNFRWARVLVWRHICMRRLSLLRVDLILPWVHSLLDIRYHFSSARLPYIDAKPEQLAMYLPWPFRRTR